jgi:eukaryotic-like serine/threonine-protein kinase
MGEVYCAWDARLEREVAVKVLPATAASDPDRRRRFEQEAKAAGALHHPNLLAVYDVGSHEDAPYIVSEKLEGETLRARLGARDLTPRKAVEYSVQAARGLATAHQQGIVHRDLKPENLFVCRDGTVKILDFGLAKLHGTSGSEDETASHLTHPGTIVGTVSYMSPEQVRGLPVDPRSDIFSLGVVLYEMLTGRRPFGGESAAEVQAAILREEPVELTAAAPGTSTALDRLVRRCLEKRPQDRFDTARDVALSLEAVAGISGEAPGTASFPKGLPRRRSWTGLAAALLAAAALGGGVAWYLRPQPATPTYAQLTFRRGTISGARFESDGETVVYSAAWDGQPSRVFTTRIGSRESRDLGLEGVVLAVSPQGEIAVKLGRFPGETQRGTLARVSISGGAPREILEDVVGADWDEEGRDLAVVHVVSGRRRLEYPIGHVLYEPEGGLSSVRALPGGFGVIEHLADGGASPYAVSLVDAKGGRRVLSSGWADPAFSKMGWLKASREIVFAASDGFEAVLRAVTPAGRARVVAQVPGDFFFIDVDPRGRVLLARTFPRGGVLALPPGAAREEDLSWLDLSFVADLSDDGRQLLIAEGGGGLLGRGGIGLRRTDGSPTVSLGDGGAIALSPDGRLVVATPDWASAGDHLLLVPTAAGSRRELRHPSLPRVWDAAWFPDGRRLAVVGGETEHRGRLHVWEIDGSAPPRPVSAEGRYDSPVVSRDGRWIAAREQERPLALYPVEGGSPRPLPGSSARDYPLRFSNDGRFVFIREAGGLPARVVRVDVATGARQLWKELRPADPAGLQEISSVRITPDGTSYAYTFASSVSALYLAEGLK